MIEIFVCLLILVIVKILELALALILLPFRLLGLYKPKKAELSYREDRWCDRASWF